MRLSLNLHVHTLRIWSISQTNMVMGFGNDRYDAHPAAIYRKISLIWPNCQTQLLLTWLSQDTDFSRYHPISSGIWSGYRTKFSCSRGPSSRFESGMRWYRWYIWMSREGDRSYEREIHVNNYGNSRNVVREASSQYCMRTITGDLCSELRSWSRFSNQMFLSISFDNKRSNAQNTVYQSDRLSDLEDLNRKNRDETDHLELMTRSTSQSQKHHSRRIQHYNLVLQTK
jgi:hypothetical protein